MKTTLLSLALGFLAMSPGWAVDIFYKKTLSLFVIHDAEKGNSEGKQLDTAVGEYCADGGAVIYLKGQTLHLVRNTRTPEIVSLDTGVANFKLKDGIIAYTKGEYLYVRKVSDDYSVASRRVVESQGASDIDIAGGTVVFMKNKTTLYRISDCDTAKAERVIYPVGEVQISE